jgi:hypothetical protein
MQETSLEKDLAGLKISEQVQGQEGNYLILRQVAESSNNNCPRHSTTIRNEGNSSGNAVTKTFSRPNSTSISDILGAIGLKSTNVTKKKRLSNLNPATKNLLKAGSEESIKTGKKSGAGSASSLAKDTNKSEEPTGLSRLLNFGKRSKPGTKLHDVDSSSNPQIRGNAKRDRETSLVPANSLPAKAPPGSNSAYDIRPINLQRSLTLDDYYLIRRVGKGGFATVFLVRLKSATGRYYALKAMKKSEVVRLRQEKQIMNEKNILLELKHWLLVELYHTFQTPSHLFMIMEFVCGGDLFTLLRKTKV